MATGKYNSLGSAMVALAEWRSGDGVTTMGYTGRPYSGPVVCLMGWTHSYPNGDGGYVFEESQTTMEQIGQSGTFNSREIGQYVVGHAPLVNPRIYDNIVWGDSTFIPTVPTGQTADGVNILTQICGVMIGVDILEPDGSRYLTRPIFWFDALEDRLGLGLPRTISGHGLRVELYNSNILHL